MIASIPSPENGTIDLGPLSVHAYGICIALGVLAAVWLAAKRWKALGGSPDDVTLVATWGVPAGIIGARIYHVVTDWELYDSDPIRAFAIWDGGLGIWGGISAGVAVGAVVARKRGLPVLTLLDVAAPALALAQAIGRFGNYFNQELFGKPTTLPWGLEIDPKNRPDGYMVHSTFHPTFLYESLWNIGLCLTLIAIGRRLDLKPGKLFLLYVAGYTFARFFIEQIRIDFAHTVGGLRINEWTSLLMFTAAVLILAVSGLRKPKAISSEGSE